MRVSQETWSRRSRTLCRALLVGCLPLAAWSYTPSAHAQEASAQDIAQARQLGQQAQAAYEAGSFAEAERLFGAACKLYTLAPTLTLGLARAQARLGKVVAAQESYNKIIREWGTNAAAPPAFKDALEAARSEVGAVSARIATITVTIDGPPSPTVTIDGQPVPSAALGLKRPVDPGTHKVAATAEGYGPAETSFTAVAGAASTVSLKLDKAGARPLGVGTTGAPPAPSPSPSPAEPPGADAHGKGSSNKTLALVAFGVGGAGLVVGGVTGVLALGKAGDLKTACNADKICPPNEQSNVDSYKAMGTISTIGFVVAGVGGVAGALLWFTAPKETARADGARYATVPAARSRGLSVTPYLSGTSAGVTGRF
jgi:hypothetical protein